MNGAAAVGSRLIFILSPERSGSTMLQMMLEAHSQVLGVPEPCLMVAMKYLGYYAAPQRAPYDPVNQSLALREFVQRLPGGEADYLDACRAYSDTLYTRMLQTDPARSFFVDKSTPNVLAWDFIVRVYPQARYIALVRHPLAIVHSYARSFFVDDYALMAQSETRIPEHIRSVAAFLREARVPRLHVRYEDIVHQPEVQARQILDFVGLPFEPAVIEYGSRPHEAGSMGDPINARRESRPQPAYAGQWIQALAADPDRRAIAERVLAEVSDQDLETYGYPRSQWPAELAAGAAQATGRPARGEPRAARSGRGGLYALQRRGYFALRRLAERRWFRRRLESLRYYCDVILRE